MKNVDLFLATLNRLKESIDASKDKEVAEALGMSDKALNARKTRNSFPELEVLALLARRPELNLDTTYVLTGKRVSDWQRSQFALTAKTVLEMEPDGNGPLHQSLLEAVKTVGSQQTVRQPEFDRLQEVLSYHDDDEFKMVLELAFTLAERLRGLRAKQPGASVKKPARKTA